MDRVELKIEGMSCSHCVAAVHNALTTVPGVRDANVSLDEGLASVAADEGITPDALAEAVRQAGYSAKPRGSR